MAYISSQKGGQHYIGSRKVYDLDENGERIKLPSGRWKSHKEDEDTLQLPEDDGDEDEEVDVNEDYEAESDDEPV